ncbi:TadE-like protein [Melghirimyces thermohalophilus]|uniref:TadE-like protein n=1 Tax=Melghirimyces thermohalophilus TaxID=1236220 RepID=A0A1G6RX88_9BACL|nr:peptidoglycan DD-metalloendopeptidase family protein [Melghirimyces thermohalophilus]SDD09282.1 TadE-like protein [Melghirimyces thermohalophilus]
MKKWITMIRKFSHRRRKGASTIEFVIILPLFFVLCMVVWQFVITGMAVMDTQAALRDAVKVAATTGNVEKAEKLGKESFGDSTQYVLDDFEVEIKDGEAFAKAKTQVPILFMTTEPYTYENSSKAPVLEFAQGHTGPMSGGKFARPVNLAYGCDIHCYDGHTGQDFPGDIGTDVYAAEDGYVEKVVHLGDDSYGTYIVIDHGGGIKTLYAHMYPWQPTVFTGERVKRGQKIGGVGNNGNSSGPHLHFEVKVNGSPVDPRPYIE